MKFYKKEYNALDIAKYVINECNKKGYEISNLKLQKILYFIQAQFIFYNNKICFEEDLECWSYGPVVEEVYSYFREFGSLEIPYQKDGIMYDIGEGKFIDKEFKLEFYNEDDKSIIDNVIELTAKKSAFELVEITHEQKPWKDNHEAGKRVVIPISSMFNFFGMNNHAEEIEEV